MQRNSEYAEGERLKPFTCPVCRSSRIRYLEDATLVWEVTGLNDDGTLSVYGHYDLFSEINWNARFICGECDHTFPMGAIKVEWY